MSYMLELTNEVVGVVIVFVAKFVFTNTVAPFEFVSPANDKCVACLIFKPTTVSFATCKLICPVPKMLQMCAIKLSNSSSYNYLPYLYYR